MKGTWRNKTVKGTGLGSSRKTTLGWRGLDVEDFFSEEDMDKEDFYEEDLFQLEDEGEGTSWIFEEEDFRMNRSSYERFLQGRDYEERRLMKRILQLDDEEGRTSLGSSKKSTLHEERRLLWKWSSTGGWRKRDFLDLQRRGGH